MNEPINLWLKYFWSCSTWGRCLRTIFFCTFQSPETEMQSLISTRTKKYALKSSLAASCSVAPSSDSLGLRFEFFTWLSYIELSLLLSSLWSDWPWSLRVQQLWSNKHFSERDGDLWIETCTLLSGDDWQRGLRSEWGWIMALTRLSAAQARVLCLHYYSNALGFNFQDEDEVNWGWDCLSLFKVFVRRSTERIR